MLHPVHRYRTEARARDSPVMSPVRGPTKFDSVRFFIYTMHRLSLIHISEPTRPY